MITKILFFYHHHQYSMYSEAGYGDIYFSILEKQLNFNVLSQPYA